MYVLGAIMVGLVTRVCIVLGGIMSGTRVCIGW